jgi:hypothetical protein
MRSTRTAPALPEATWFKLCRHGGAFQHGVVALLGFGRRDVADGPRRGRLLNRSTHSSVANSAGLGSGLRNG